MLTDLAFLEFRWTQIPETQCQVQLESMGAATYISRVKVDIEQFKISSSYGKLLPDQLVIEVTERWRDKPGPGLVARGELQLRVEKIPLRVQAETSLESVGTGRNQSLRRINGNLRVDIPLIGGKVEREILTHLPDFAHGEEEAAKRWLAK